MDACELGIAELYKGEYEKLTDATKGLLRENLIKLRDEQYKAEKVGNTIFWGKSGTSNGGGIAIGKENEEDLRAQSHAPNGDGTTARAAAGNSPNATNSKRLSSEYLGEDLRVAERWDRSVDTRYSLPDPDPSEVFYDEIPIFDEQGNEIDLHHSDKKLGRGACECFRSYEYI